MNRSLAFTTRPATADDNDALKQLAAACPMRAAVSICVHRNPDYFALSRLTGEQWNVSVVEGTHGEVVGCIAMAEYQAYLDEKVAQVTYASDLKMHPDYRGLGAADSLSRTAWEWCAATGPGAPAIISVLKGNRAMERRIEHGRGMPASSDLGIVRVYTVGLLWRRRLSRSRYSISRATSGDLAEMANLWTRVARRRQLARVLTSDSLASWIEQAPGLNLSDYWLARDHNGRIVGFAAFWDQRLLKQLHVVGLTTYARLFRKVFNCLAPAFGAARFPRPGEPLHGLSALHVCVPGDQPGVLRDIFISVTNEFRGRFTFFAIGLDPRDPLTHALKGFWSVSIDVGVYLFSPDGRFRGSLRTDLPIHFETALV